MVNESDGEEIMGITRSARVTRATRFGRSLSLPPSSEAHRHSVTPELLQLLQLLIPHRSFSSVIGNSRVNLDPRPVPSLKTVRVPPSSLAVSAPL
jgi:hypothetical protein